MKGGIILNHLPIHPGAMSDETPLSGAAGRTGANSMTPGYQVQFLRDTGHACPLLAPSGMSGLIWTLDAGQVSLYIIPSCLN